jgi:hypothetical protein
MADADVVMASVLANGTVLAYDMWSPDQLQPRLDIDRGGRTNTYNVTGACAGGACSVSFVRPLLSGDKNDVNITDTAMRVLYLYHPTQPGNGVTFASHNPLQRGTGTSLLLLPLGLCCAA